MESVMMVIGSLNFSHCHYRTWARDHDNTYTISIQFSCCNCVVDQGICHPYEHNKEEEEPT